MATQTTAATAPSRRPANDHPTPGGARPLTARYATDDPDTPSPGGASQRPWHPYVTEGCRRCHLTDLPHVARGLCTTCYSAAQKRGDLLRYPAVPHWPTFFGRHGARRNAVWGRQRDIWYTDGPLIRGAVALPSREQRPRMPLYGSPRATDDAARAA